MIEHLQELAHALGLDDPNVLAAVSRAVVAVIGAWTAVEGLCKVIARTYRGIAKPAALGVGRGTVAALAGVWAVAAGPARRRRERVQLAQAKADAKERAAIDRDRVILATLNDITTRAERLDKLREKRLLAIQREDVALAELSPEMPTCASCGCEVGSLVQGACPHCGAQWQGEQADAQPACGCGPECPGDCGCGCFHCLGARTAHQPHRIGDDARIPRTSGERASVDPEAEDRERDRIRGWKRKGA